MTVEDMKKRQAEIVRQLGIIDEQILKLNVQKIKLIGVQEYIEGDIRLAESRTPKE
jgi:hypothetical protein